MPWWGWVALGIILLGAEMALIDAEFYLVFIGISALLVGLADLAGLTVPAWSEFLIFAVLAGASMVFFRRRVYARIKGNAKEIETVPTGDRISVAEDIAAGAAGRATYRGSTWNVINVGSEPIKAGSTALIQSIDGTTLNISS